MWYSLLTHFGAAAGCTNKSSFFGIPPWYQYLKVEVNQYSKACELNVSLSKSDGSLDFTTISLIGLGVVDILLRIAALVAIGYIIYGGVQYVTSQGEPDRIKHATGTVTNAIIGLVITILAAAFVRFIGSRIGA